METLSTTSRGDRVKFARSAAGFTQTELADAIKKLAGDEDETFTQQALSKLEANRSIHSWAMIYIAKLTGYSAWWMETGEGPPQDMELTAREYRCLAAFRQLDADRQYEAIGAIQQMLKDDSGNAIKAPAGKSPRRTPMPITQNR